jgi:hypothetical protein
MDADAADKLHQGSSRCRCCAETASTGAELLPPCCRRRAKTMASCFPAALRPFSSASIQSANGFFAAFQPGSQSFASTRVACVRCVGRRVLAPWLDDAAGSKVMLKLKRQRRGACEGWSCSRHELHASCSGGS